MKQFWIALLALTLTVTLTAGCAATPAAAAAKALAAPDYPDETNDAKTPAAVKDALEGFALASAPLVLDAEENAVYSPVSLYYALAMLSECAYGDTKNEVMQALGLPCDCDWSEALQTLFEALYFDNDSGRLLLANSIWLSDDVTFRENTLKRLAENYYAYSYQVDMADADGTAKRIAKWVQDNTNGLLGKDENAFRPKAEELARLINAIYFYDKWQMPFEPDVTQSGDFFKADGSTVQADYMYSASSAAFARNERYTASSLWFENGGQMIFILPEQGVTPTELLSDSAALSAALHFADRVSDDAAADAHRGMVRWQIPKFGFGKSMKLNDTLKAMGIALAFDPEQADLSNLTDVEAYLSSASQDACIRIDEYGCEAAAFTQMAVCGTAMPVFEAEMYLTRPFVFAVTAPTGDVIFLGTVNDPTEQ